MRLLRTVLVAPSQYDERGVVVYRIGMAQNGALGALAGLIEDYNRRHAGTAEIRYEIFDEHVREAVRPELLRRWRDEAARNGERFVLMICGVTTPTYPRGRDVALMARREGLTVIAGGVHLSGHGPSAEFLSANGVSVAIGEVEPIWDHIIADAFNDSFAPIYRIGADSGLRIKTAVSDISAPDLTHIPFPHMPKRYLSRYITKSHLYIDSSRGCPYLCTFCTVKNLFGRTVRSRDPQALVAWMAERIDHNGIRTFTFTDDNFVRNPRRLEILEGLAKLRASGRRFSVSVILDVESTCYVDEESERGERTRSFLALCQAAGVNNVFMGLESTNDAALQEIRKGVNRDRSVVHGTASQDPATAIAEAHRAIIARYRTAIRAWQAIGATVECGYIIGFAGDGPGAGKQAARDLEAIGIDMVNFFLLSPLPGAEDYARAVTDGTLLVKDFNEYFRHRPVVAHPTMTPAVLQAELKTAVHAFYSFKNVAVRLVRGLLGLGRPRVLTPLVFAKRQLGYKAMLFTGACFYFEAGLLRRRRGAVARDVVTDAEARVHFLGATAPQRATGLPAGVLRDGQMDSLPILSRHEIPATPVSDEVLAPPAPLERGWDARSLPSVAAARALSSLEGLTDPTGNGRAEPAPTAGPYRRANSL